MIFSFTSMLHQTFIYFEWFQAVFFRKCWFHLKRDQKEMGGTPKTRYDRF